MIKQISSLQSLEVKNVVRLHDKKGRSELRFFIAQGPRVIKTFVSSNWSPVALYVTEENLDDALKLCPEKIIRLVSSAVMEKISTVITPSGMLALFNIPQEPSLDLLGPGLVCAKISDPGNLGTLIRSSVAFGKKSIVTIECADIWSPKVVQASAGNIAQLNIFQFSWKMLVTHVKEKKIPLCALVISGGKEDQQLDLSKSLLIVGSEAHGIDKKWLDDCEQRLTLQMSSSVESLNAAVAGSIALYLAFKQS